MLDALKAAFAQTLNLAALGFMFAVILHYLEVLTTRAFQRSVGRAGIYITGWIGTPVHELGHAAFCVLFRHRIIEVELFSPDPATGTLGYVKHSWDRRSIYQRAGNFFIGVAPLIFGAVVMFVVLRFVSPNGERLSGQALASSSAFDTGVPLIGQFKSILRSAWGLFLVLLDPAAARSGWFWLAVYVSLCIASHMGPSKVDIEGAWPGALITVAFLFAANVIAWALGADIVQAARWGCQRVAVILSLLLLSVVVSAANFVLSYVALSVIHYMRTGRGLPLR